MAVYDVFNGDADGICALIQLRLESPKSATLITGVKRDISLLERVDAGEGDLITVLDVSMLKNAQALEKNLVAGAQVFYADHHQAGDIPSHSNLTALINPSSDICTGLIINGHLKGKHYLWAITAAFGDNLIETATRVAKQHGLTEHQTEQLSRLGTYINYNGYGASLDDLFFHPATLYQELLASGSPLDFINGHHPAYATLEQGYLEDLEKAASAQTITNTESSAAKILPNERWARRVSGVYGNDLANQAPDKAHAVLTEQEVEGVKGYVVSIRAPLNNKVAADTLASQFPSGGGRKGAAGINFLPENKLSHFLSCLESTYAKT